VDFEEAYRAFVEFHRSRRRGERRRRFDEGHGHAELLFLKQVWWPAFGNFRDLHPEYEVSDFKDGYRYLDFAFIRGGVRLAIEIDGYGPHVARVSRRDFSDQLHRQNQLVVDGWAVLRFSYDDVNERPRRCQQMIQQFLGRRLAGIGSQELTFLEREVVRLAQDLGRPLRPRDVCEHLDIGKHRAVSLLRGLVKKGWFDIPPNRQRLRYYILNVRTELGLVGERRPTPGGRRRLRPPESGRRPAGEPDSSRAIARRAIEGRKSSYPGEEARSRAI